MLLNSLFWGDSDNLIQSFVNGCISREMRVLSTRTQTYRTRWGRGRCVAQPAVYRAPPNRGSLSCSQKPTTRPHSHPQSQNSRSRPSRCSSGSTPTASNDLSGPVSPYAAIPQSSFNAISGFASSSCVARAISSISWLSCDGARWQMDRVLACCMRVGLLGGIFGPAGRVVHRGKQ